MIKYILILMMIPALAFGQLFKPGAGVAGSIDSVTFVDDDSTYNNIPGNLTLRKDWGLDFDFGDSNIVDIGLDSTKFLSLSQFWDSLGVIYDSATTILEGMAYDKATFSLINSHSDSTIVLDIEKVGGGNIIFHLDGVESTLDCITGAGASGTGIEQSPRGGPGCRGRSRGLGAAGTAMPLNLG